MDSGICVVLAMALKLMIRLDNAAFEIILILGGDARGSKEMIISFVARVHSHNNGVTEVLEGSRSGVLSSPEVR